MLEPRVVLNGAPIIGEFMAINDDTFVDEDGDTSDWIELYNPTDAAIELGGWYLTDDAEDLDQWRFPAVTMDAGDYLLVFASGKDKINPNESLHTNFKLSGNGEYVALTRPDRMTVESKFGPAGAQYPTQLADMSYGVGTTPVEVPLVASDADIQYLVPTSAEQLSTDWKEAGFADPDGVWTANPGGNGVGFQSDGQEFAEFIQTDLTGVMAGQNASAFARAEFEVPTGVSLEDLTLRVRSDDGFVTYLNGTEVARRNAPATPVWNSTATSERDNAEAVQLEEIPLTTGRLLSDFHTISDNTFLVDLPSGMYDVTIRQGDRTRVRDEMTVFLEDVEVDTVTTQEGEIVTNTYRVEVNDSQLSLRLQDQGGATGRSVINAVMITPVGAIDGFSTLALDFGIPTSPVQPGAIQIHEGNRYSPEVGHGWLTDAVIGVARPQEDSNLQLVQAGSNVLAFQGLNVEATNADFLLQFELSGTRLQLETNQIGYFSEPTPGEPNVSVVAPLLATPPGYSVASGTFVGDFTLDLTTNVPGGVIHYTLDQTVPTAASAVFDLASPISITTTTQVRAIVVAPGHLPSPVLSQSYLALAADVQEFTSDVPLVVLENFGGGSVPNTSTGKLLQSSTLAIFDRGDDGRSSLADEASLITRAGIRIRGSSSQLQPKKQYRVETWTEENQDKDVSPLGMPAESDWILVGPYHWDRGLFRTPFMYELSDQIGRYAPRTRIVEAFLNDGGGPLSEADYIGVYILVEKIKRGPDRVDVERLSPEDHSEPEITGGYMLKIDHGCWVKCPPTIDKGFHTSRGLPTGNLVAYFHEYPSPEEISPEQHTWIRKYLEDFEDALYGANFTDPQLGYAKYIDVGSFIDQHWLQELAKNEDGLRLSAFMYKPRGGRLTMGPIWDLNAGLSPDPDGGTVSRLEPENWQLFTHFDWWGRLFDDPDFEQKWIDRWYELRRDQFSIGNLHAMMDSVADELREAQHRNFLRWTQKPPRFGDWQVGEIDRVKQWLVDRIAWIERQFLAPPQFSSPSGQFVPGLELNVSAPIGSVYYTTDGSDPRLPGGDLSLSAILADGPIPVSGPTKFIARTHSGGDWSAPMEARFVEELPAAAGNLAITEINYNPPDPTAEEWSIDAGLENDDFEFIELLNISDQQVFLTGVQLTAGVRFDFTASSVTALGAGERVVVVRNLAGFQARYGNGLNVAGVYDGRLNNDGEQLVVTNRFGDTIHDFTYDDDRLWPGRADGNGSSLEAIETSGDYNDDDNWRSSSEYAGSPGEAGVGPVTDIVVNEVLTNTVEPLVDAIELYNTTGSAVDVSGWYLSDSNDRYRKFHIPDNTTIEPRGFLVLDEEDFNGSGDTDVDFALDGAEGDDVWLLAGDANGRLIRFVDRVEFGATAEGQSLGRWPNGSGALFPMTEATLGHVNSGPQMGPVILSEILYDVPLNVQNLLEANFNTDTDRFAYLDNPFNETDAAETAFGKYKPDKGLDGGGVNVVLGPWQVGLPSAATSGGWSHTFQLVHDGIVTVSLDYRLVVSDGLDSGDVGAAILEIDEVRYGGSTDRALLQVSGDGQEDFGWRAATFQIPLSAGPHTITMGAWYHGFGDFDEWLRAFFDNVSVITQVDPDQLEFIELYNTTDEPVELSNWQLGQGVDFTFAADTIIQPRSTVVVLPFDPNDPNNASGVANFRATYGIDDRVPLVGGFAGQLDNDGEQVQLLRPHDSPPGRPDFVPRILVDEVHFDNEPPWPQQASGMGQSLGRKTATSFGNFVASWTAADPTPGAVTFVQLGDLDLDGEVDEQDILDFVLALNSPDQYETTHGVPVTRHGDMDGDGDVDFDDIDDLVTKIQSSAMISVKASRSPTASRQSKSASIDLGGNPYAADLPADPYVDLAAHALETESVWLDRLATVTL